MLAFVYVASFVVGAWAPFVWAHREVHGVVNPAHLALTLFNAVNVLICVWEHALFLHRGKIKREHARLKRKHGDRALPKPLCLFEHVSLSRALSYEHWSVIWSQYALLDPSYADQRSFGFWIDYGNGVVTLPATLLLSHAATYAGKNAYFLSTEAVAVVGIVVNYQMLYGTVLYFCNYALNGYARGASNASVATVIVANAIWIVFPGWWMWVCWDILTKDAFTALR
jgi:hypothetical protein